MADVNLIIKQTLNITCMKNDTFSLDMDWTNSASVAVDLTLYTFKVQVKRNAASSIALLTFEDSDFSKDSAGNLTMTKAAADMDIEAGVYHYDMQATTIADNSVATWMGGRFTISEDVTI